MQVLLHPSPALLQGVTGETDDVERVHHSDRLGELISCGGLEPGEAVQGHDLDPLTPRLGAGGEPGREDRLGAALDHVEQPCRAGLAGDGGEVDDHRHVLVASAGVTPHMLVHAQHPHPVEAGGVGDEHPAALCENRVVGSVPRHGERSGDLRHEQMADDQAVQCPGECPTRQPRPRLSRLVQPR
jgi:hypothetical protein